MKKRMPLLITVSLVGWLLLEPAAAAVSFDLFGVTSSGSLTNPNTLIKLDPTNGAQTAIGQFGSVPNSRKVDWNPLTSSLFGTDVNNNSGVIQEIDPATGIATNVATIRDGGNLVDIGAISFAADGVLYGVSGNNIFTPSMLGVIDLASETFSSLLEIPAGNLVAGIDIAADGTLYAVYQEFAPSLMGQTLTVIDTDTLKVLDEISLGLPTVDDIDFAPDGFLYHSNFSNALFRLDPATGVQSNVGFGTVGALAGLASAPVPIPGAVLLLASALVGLLGRARRRI